MKSNFWTYRICRKFTVYKDKQYPFYCIVRYVKNFPNYRLTKKGAFRIKGYKNVWSEQPEYPFGETKKQVIENLKLMLYDALEYYDKPVIEKEPWKDTTSNE